MKKLNLVIALFSIAFINAQTNWNFDSSHSTVRFAVDHMVISEIEGQFTTYEGTVETTKDDFSEAKINFSIDVNSVDTDDVKRDGHLKSEDFFNTVKYPKMTFVSTSIQKIKEGKYTLKGNFTLLGVTKEVALNMSYGGTVKDPWGNTKAGLKVTGAINRTDFGLKYNSVMEAGGLLIGEDITITCKMELMKI
jgi:polyisoprenoid-binding protein YceI